MGTKRLFLCLLALIAFTAVGYTSDSLPPRSQASSALSHYIMAVLHDDLGDTESAIREYQKALKEDDKNITVHLGLASAYLRDNDTEKAIEELNLAASLDPAAPEPHTILALVYSLQDKLGSAQKEYELALQKASKLTPQNIEIYKSLGLLYIQQNKFREAEEAFKSILELAPKEASAHFYLANIYDILKDRKAAIDELKKALEIKGDYHEALNYLGYIYVEDNVNLGQAGSLIKKALAIEPDNGAYVDSLGWFYFKKAKYKDALRELKRAASLTEDPVIYDHLGDAFYKLKDTQNALDNWERSLKMKPGQEGLRKKIEEITKSQETITKQ